MVGVLVDRTSAANVGEYRRPRANKGFTTDPMGEIFLQSRKPVDSAPVRADHPAHRAARMASDVIKGAVPKGGETRSKKDPVVVFLRWVVTGSKPSEHAASAVPAPPERPVLPIANGLNRLV